METDIIEKLGGAKALAEVLGVTKTAVTNWRLAGRNIPWKHRYVIANMAAARAITLPADFWERHA